MTGGWWSERRRQAWREVAERTGGRFVHANAHTRGSDVVEVTRETGRIKLDTVPRLTRRHTRTSAVFFNPTRLRFAIHRGRLPVGLRRLLGWQGIEIGRDGFDRHFVVSTPHPRRVRSLLLAQGRLRRLMLVQPRLHRSVLDDDLPPLRARGTFSQELPHAVDLLHFHVAGVIADPERLLGLFEIFRIVLDSADTDADAGSNEVGRLIRRLRSSGGAVWRGNVIVWNGHRLREDAIRRLGALGDARAVPSLTEILDDPQDPFRLEAIDALRQIGDTRAVGPLLRLLGSKTSARIRGPDDVLRPNRLRGLVHAALVSLGERRLADALLATLELGDTTALRTEAERHRADVIEALLTAIREGSRRHAARALCDLRAVEALGALKRELNRPEGGAPDEKSARDAAALAEAIAELELRTTLPRPAGSPGVPSEGLPRPTSAAP